MVPDFFEFMKSLDTDKYYLNSFDGKLGIKKETGEYFNHEGLCILHPFFEHIPLLPTE